jgi:pilus assembly protein CpaB
MNRRFILALSGAVFFGLMAIWAAQKYVQSRVTRDIAETQTRLVIARTAIPIGAAIGPEHIQIVDYPIKLKPEGAIPKADEVVGRVAYVNIPAKLPILNSQLAGLGAQPGLPGVTTEGMRSVSVRVDESSGVAGFITPGSYVDVIAIMTPQLEGAKQVSKVILQRVKALAGGQQMQSKADGKAALVNTVTLEVTPAQAEKLKLAEAEGRLQLSIRNATDQIIERTPGATRRDVLDDIALEQRARIGVRDGFYSGGARPMATPPTFNFNLTGNQPQAGQATPVQKVIAPRGPVIELIEGGKRSRVEINP